MLKRRVIVALLSAFIISLVLAYISYTPMAERESNSWYESFQSLVTVSLIFSVPAYLLGGLPISFYIDKYTNRKFVRFIFYLIGGFFVGMATIVFSFKVVPLNSFGLV